VSDATVRRLTDRDRAGWAAMRTALYTQADPQADAGALAAEIDAMLARDDWAAFGAATAEGRLVGLIELFERNVAESCETSPVTYVEGLWVDPQWRRRGLARRLLAAAMDWGRARGRSEIASDVQIANLVSQAVHRRLGFAETERLVTYRLGIPARAGRPGG
jgi:aminoglycoside 6'-N-acetyltransferase I